MTILEWRILVRFVIPKKFLYLKFQCHPVHGHFKPLATHSYGILFAQCRGWVRYGSSKSPAGSFLTLFNFRHIEFQISDIRTELIETIANLSNVIKKLDEKVDRLEKKIENVKLSVDNNNSQNIYRVTQLDTLERRVENLIPDGLAIKDLDELQIVIDNCSQQVYYLNQTSGCPYRWHQLPKNAVKNETCAYVHFDEHRRYNWNESRNYCERVLCSQLIKVLENDTDVFVRWNILQSPIKHWGSTWLANSYDEDHQAGYVKSYDVNGKNHCVSINALDVILENVYDPYGNRHSLVGRIDLLGGKANAAVGHHRYVPCCNSYNFVVCEKSFK